MRGLAGYLKDESRGGRRRARAARYSGEPSVSGMSQYDHYGPQQNGLPPAKRPRLEEAAKLEDQRCGIHECLPLG